MTPNATTAARRQLRMPSSFIGNSSPRYLTGFKDCATNWPGRVYFHDPVVDSHRKLVESPCSRRTEDIAPNVKCGAVTGAGESLFIGIPGHGASKVGALAMQSQESSVIESCKIEMSFTKGCHSTGLEPLNRSGNALGAFVRRCTRLAAASKKRCGNPARFQQGQSTKQRRQPGQETAPWFVYICHGHINAIPAPRNQTPVTVRTVKLTANNTNIACTVSLTVAEKYFLRDM